MTRTLYDVILEILKRPELYLGEPSLERLYAFLSGFLYQNELADDHCLDGFNEYIADIYRIQVDRNWASIIRFFSNSDQEAFEKFRKYFSDYTNAKQ